MHVYLDLVSSLRTEVVISLSSCPEHRPLFAALFTLLYPIRLDFEVELDRHCIISYYLRYQWALTSRVEGILTIERDTLITVMLLIRVEEAFADLPHSL